jgi:peptidoglycan/xylan/chitin deacetylase (PgdA/CDA1 family)
MPSELKYRRRRALLLCLLAALLAACAAPPALPVDPTLPPVRFLLTFDDGPSGQKLDNPTAEILDNLRNNPVQPDIKALFFVQPLAEIAGASAVGHPLLLRSVREGQLLGLHSGSVAGHINHCSMSDAELRATLAAGVAAITAVAGAGPRLVRPPYWDYNARTLAAYADNGLAMLLTDISANDGKTRGFIASPRRRSHIRAGLLQMRQFLQAGAIPSADGVAPIVVAFHDTNSYTARHMAEYLQILVEEAHTAGLRLAAQPFYSDRAALQAAALVRAADAGHRRAMVPALWSWWWRADIGSVQ